MRKIVKALAALIAAFTVIGVATPAHASLAYFYSGANQTLTVAETQISALMTVASPTLAAGDFHTLMELSAESTNQQQIVEVGWSEDPSTWGDSKPRLFVYHWINGGTTCYSKVGNLCGFSLYSSRVNTPGDDLTSFVGASTPPVFGIQQFSGAWWIAFNGSWVGSFSNTLWSGASPSVTFADFGHVNVFGEVAANVASPCTDMGNGILGTSASSAAKISSVTYSGAGNPVNLSPFGSSNNSWYTAQLISGSVRTIRVGGPGAC